MKLYTTLLANHFYWVFLSSLTGNLVEVFLICLEFYADVLEITVCFFPRNPLTAATRRSP